MRRSLFFWLEKLKITPAERKTISALMVVLAGLSLAHMAVTPSDPFDADRYAELDRQFAERTAALEQEEQKRLERYFPPEEQEALVTAAADTVPEQPAGAEAERKEPEQTESTQKGRINVNTADQETLQALPGIGPAYSERIIKYRKQYGEFKTLEELKKIKGIGEKRLEKLKPFIKLKDSE